MEERDLPVGWVNSALGDIVEFVYGKSLPARTRVDGDVPVFGSNGVVGNHKEALVSQPCIIIGRKGSVGEVHFSEVPAWPIDTTYYISEPGPFNLKYLFFLLKGLGLSELNKATAIPGLNRQDAYQLNVDLPPEAEQHRIAAKLDTTLAAVEACRQRLDGVAAILKRFRQTVLAAATSGELTREWREGRRIEVAPTISLGEIIKVSSGKFLPAKAMVACGGVPVYGGNGVNGLHNESNVCEPTLVIGRVGYYCGSIHLTPEKAWVTDNALVVRHDAASTRKKYLYYALQSVDLRANDSSTAQPVISGSKIYPLRLIRPCVEEQDEIIDRVESLFTLADQLEARLNAARKIVDRLTPAVLAQAFRGELVPQDPGDEPASVLLERIRAARQAEAAAGKPSRRGRRKASTNPDQIAMEAAPVPLDFLAGLLRECGALSERALLAVSELEPQRFQQQLYRELESGTAREVQADGQLLLEAVG